MSSLTGAFSVTSISRPSSQTTANNLLNANFYTRIHVLAPPGTVQAAVANTEHLRSTFMFCHLSDILIFDREHEQYVTHLQVIFQMLRDSGMKAGVDRCEFEKTNWADAGFYVDELGINSRRERKAFMVVLRENLAADSLKAIDRTL